MFLSRIIFSIAAVVPLNFELCFCACARAEYEIAGECCPMCAPGTHVYWHCTVDTTTTCVPCPQFSYTDESNGLLKCLSCSVCEAVHGLRVKKPCTHTADVICEPQEGFYCISQNKHSCALAVQHSKCNPGQYIKQTGTAFTDTICTNCRDGTFSNGSLLACQSHSKCEMEGLTEIKAGTSSTDAECGKSTPVALIVGVTVIILVTITTPTTIYFIFKRRKQHLNKRVCYTSQPESDLEPNSADSVTSLFNNSSHLCAHQKFAFS